MQGLSPRLSGPGLQPALREEVLRTVFRSPPDISADCHLPFSEHMVDRPESRFSSVGWSSSASSEPKTPVGVQRKTATLNIDPGSLGAGPCTEQVDGVTHSKEHDLG